MRPGFTSFSRSTLALICPSGSSIADWRMSARDRWYLESHIRRWEARYGMKYPTVSGEIGRYESFRFVQVGLVPGTTGTKCTQELLFSEVLDPEDFGSTLKPHTLTSRHGMPWYRHKQRW